MKIGIMADSHDNLPLIARAVDLFNHEKVELVLHAGDFVSPFTATLFQNLKPRLVAVFGNNDGEKLFLKSSIGEFGGEIYEDVYRGEIGGKRGLMTHKPNIVEEAAESGKYDLVIYGHTHKQDIHQVGDTLVINPGEATDWFGAKSEVVILELDDMSYQARSLAEG